MNDSSRVTGGLIKHPLFDQARLLFEPMCLDAGDGLVLLLLGPPQSGKSIILQQIVRKLNKSFADARPGAIPIAGLTLETVGDGRAKNKWIGLQLLKELRHPVYEHIGRIDDGNRYQHSRWRDEGTIRIALGEAYKARHTRRTWLDELHLATRTKDPELRGAILESLKTACAINRTLIACGGYETAYNGLFDSAHFCGRVLVCDFGNYRPDVKTHAEAWNRILRSYSDYLKLKPRSLLIEQWEYLLFATNGVVGLVDKMLWLARVRSEALKAPIDAKLLRACAPPEGERLAIAKDIEKGNEALAVAKNVIRRDERETDDCQNRKGRPFERKPDRNAAQEVTLHEDD